uniref:hypothetical protein n=1 Tax=Sulfodiicoccus acidiphilus TaxID=1670455 RepID=UPI000F8382A4|nr:hypothetical protein [Sulfodiicoccus acidiphilus]
MRNYGNWYYGSELNVLGMSLNLHVPRDRKGQVLNSPRSVEGGGLRRAGDQALGQGFSRRK